MIRERQNQMRVLPREIATQSPLSFRDSNPNRFGYHPFALIRFGVLPGKFVRGSHIPHSGLLRSEFY
jgi:hypothetical protein